MGWGPPSILRRQPPRSDAFSATATRVLGIAAKIGAAEIHYAFAVGHRRIALTAQVGLTVRQHQDDRFVELLRLSDHRASSIGIDLANRGHAIRVNDEHIGRHRGTFRADWRGHCREGECRDGQQATKVDRRFSSISPGATGPDATGESLAREITTGK